MEIKILALIISNFKGIKNLGINFGQTTDIYGENASGKTTIFDAFTWLLFDKDSTNKKDFNIKTLDKNGEALHGLEHAVEGRLELDGRPLNLRKVFMEKWVKERGAAEKVFSGHETKYWINEVPVKKSDYQDKINSLINENIFKLITNPLFFNMNLSWQDRRKALLEIVGDISDQDVIDSNEELSRLSTLLQDKNLEDFKAMISGQKKRLNEQLKSIPIRIDELSRGIPTLDENIDYTNLEQEKKDLQIIVGNLEKDLTDQRKIAMDMMDDFKKKQSFIAQKRNELNKLSTDLLKEALTQGNKLQLEKQDTEYKLSRMQTSQKTLELSIDQDSALIEKFNKQLADKRAEYSEVMKETFNAPDRDNFICPTCKQQLPDDNIDKQISTMENNFLAKKNEKREEINESGKSLSTKVKELQQGIERNKAKIDELTENIKASNNKLETLTIQISQENAKASQVNYESDERYIALKLEIMSLEKVIETPQNDSGAQYDLITKKTNCNQRIDEINKILNNKQVIADTQRRIVQLEEKQIDIASKVLELEGQEYLAEQFIRTKVDMLESRINSKFSQVNFKMFNEQINGALVECCDTLIKGVPFQDANNAAKINAGIDIINTLTDHYGITAPIFVDNREAVNRLIPTDSQVINLIVSQDKTLRVEAQ